MGDSNCDSTCNSTNEDTQVNLDENSLDEQVHFEASHEEGESKMVTVYIDESGSFRPRSSSPPRCFAPAAFRPRSIRPWSFRPRSRFAPSRFAPRRKINLFLSKSM